MTTKYYLRKVKSKTGSEVVHAVTNRSEVIHYYQEKGMCFFLY